MDKAIMNAIEINAECHEEHQGALDIFADACRDDDKLFYLQAATNVLKTWLRCKKMLESAHLKLLVKMVEQCPDDFGGENFLAVVRQGAAKAEGEASRNELC